MIDPALLQAYGARLPKRASDAEFIDDDVYASAGGREREVAPTGLVDRLYLEQADAMPERYPSQDLQNRRGPGMPTRLPTTKRAL